MDRARRLLEAPSAPRDRIAAVRACLNLPDVVFLFYAFGSSDRDPVPKVAPRPPVLLLEAPLAGWWNAYRQDPERYRDDPVRDVLKDAFAPVRWSELVPGGSIEAGRDELWAQVRAHGIRAGVSVALSAPKERRHGSLALITLGSARTFDSWLESMSPMLVGVAYLFHQGLEVSPEPDDRNALSPREAQCLHAVARGMSSKETARQLAISPRTVDVHIQRAMRRLGARTRAEASAIAARSIAAPGRATIIAARD